MVVEWTFLKANTAFVVLTIQTSWLGLYQIIEKFREHSFVTQVTAKSTQEVHTSQLKSVLPTLPTKVVSYCILPVGYILCTPAGVEKDLL